MTRRLVCFSLQSGNKVSFAAGTDNELILVKSSCLEDPSFCLEILASSNIPTSPFDDSLEDVFLRMVQRHAIAFSRGTVTLRRWVKTLNHRSKGVTCNLSAVAVLDQNCCKTCDVNTADVTVQVL